MIIPLPKKCDGSSCEKRENSFSITQEFPASHLILAKSVSLRTEPICSSNGVVSIGYPLCDGSYNRHASDKPKRSAFLDQQASFCSIDRSVEECVRKIHSSYPTSIPAAEAVASPEFTPRTSPRQGCKLSFLFQLSN